MPDFVRRLLFLLLWGNLLLTAAAQDGALLSQTPLVLSEQPVWSRISENGALSPEFEYLDKLAFYAIRYRSDSTEVDGLLLEPKKEGRYPVVIFNRGGNRHFAPLNVGTLILYTSRLAEQGYVIVGSNYRERDEFGGADIRDVLCLTETVKEFPRADPDRIGMFGWSRGGMMTYLALKLSAGIRTAVVGNAPTDLFALIAERPEMETGVLAPCIPGYARNKQAELEKRSALYWPEALNPKSSLLILSGSRDDRCNPHQADSLAHRLRQIGYRFELKKVDTDHYFSDRKSELNAWLIDWFDRELKETR